MAILSIKDQELVILSYEKEYGSLVMKLNHKDESFHSISRQALILLAEIEKYACERYFDNNFLWQIEAIRSSLALLAYQILAQHKLVESHA